MVANSLFLKDSDKCSGSAVLKIGSDRFFSFLLHSNPRVFSKNQVFGRVPIVEEGSI